METSGNSVGEAESAGELVAEAGEGAVCPQPTSNTVSITPKAICPARRIDAVSQRSTNCERTRLHTMTPPPLRVAPAVDSPFGAFSDTAANL
jgi:hypothetical protein